MKPPHLIQHVLVVGGTHGNEFIGIYLIKNLEANPHLLQRSSFTAKTLLANPKAFAINRRYIDKDLNRCFRQADLCDLNLSGYEEIRAREIAQQFGANGATPVDFIVDLHTTTANMGLTVIVDEHPFNVRLAAYLQSIHPQVRVYDLARSLLEKSGLPSLCARGCTIEVGPIAQGVLQASLFQQTEALLHSCLDYLDRYNQGSVPAANPSLTYYRHLGVIDYPRNQQDEIQAMIHPQLQFRDYEPLHPHEPLFLTFDGKTIPYAGTSVVYPVFINEAAYYEKGTALCLTEKQEQHVWDC
jgi:aspartoacylase